MNIIGHRGYSAKYPENTMAAFKAAIDVGADMIEFDVVMSKDGVPVILHDETLNRTTNGKGSVANHTLKELKKLDAGNGETIPTLDEVLELGKGRIGLHIEIKSEAVTDKIDQGVEQQVVQLIEKHGLQSSVIISSFSTKPLVRIRDMNKSLALAITYDHFLKEPDKAWIENFMPSAVHMAINHISAEDVDFLAIHHLPVSVYTVNAPAQMKKAQDLCVEGIFTNEIEKALQFFTRHN